jgi:PEP-CTERM motif
MKVLRSLALLAMALAVPVGAAQATILTGTFSLSVYQGSGNGNIADPNNQANSSNPLLLSSPLYAGTYTGAINFNDGGSNNILTFLMSGGGALSGSTTALNTILSTAPFGITTVFDFTWTDANRLGGAITHDDGMSLYLNGATVVDSAAPTVPTVTPFGLTATGGNYRIIYASANGLPEVLSADITQSVAPVPEPTTLLLLGLGLAAGTGIGRRRKAKRS